MDLDFLALAVLMGLFGMVGITATANVSPNVLALASCNCIPSPAARLQELSVILLVFGVGLAPIGIKMRTTQVALGARDSGDGVRYAAPLMRSGALFALGVSLVVFGVGLVAVPALLVMRSPLLFAEGIGVVAFGEFLASRGGGRS
ncbi:MAG: hypothetical protein OK455_00245 [Thaumarchaeota archaeon]|nr:hypothetical protein [Nitrososphaerota archaeon]